MMKLLTTLFLLIAFVEGFAATPVTGVANPEFNGFQKKFIKIMRKQHMPGAAVAIVKDSQIVYSRGFGWADRRNKEKVLPNSVFRLASMSKAITAIAILKLVEQQQLTLGTPANAILKLKPLPDRRFNKDINEITVQHLLNMASGWAGGHHRGFDPLFGHWPKVWLKKLKLTSPLDCKIAARYMVSRRLIAKPGTVMSYANINYCMLGLVINKIVLPIYGAQGYEDYIKHEILQPLGITDMAIASTQAANKHPREVTYYPVKGNEQLPYSETEILAKNFADGGWVASAPSIAKLMSAVADGKVFNHILVNKMIENPKVQYGRSKKRRGKYYAMGMFIYEKPIGKVWVTHGSFTGTNTYLVRRPDGLIAVFLFNRKPSYWAGLGGFRRQLLRLVLAL